MKKRSMATVADTGLGGEYLYDMRADFTALAVKGLTRIEIAAGHGPEGATWVFAWSLATNVETAFEAVRLVLDRLATGKETFIRAEPAADTQTDFETREVLHVGYVRFSFFDKPGVWHPPAPAPQEGPIYLGFR